MMVNDLIGGGTTHRERTDFEKKEKKRIALIFYIRQDSARSIKRVRKYPEILYPYTHPN